MEQFFEFIGNHPILSGAFVLVFALFVRNEVARGGRSVTPQELVNMVNREKAVVIDVRDPNEYSQGHIVYAINVPHAALSGRVSELAKYKDHPVVLACKMGQHSGAAGTVLRKAGFQNVSRLKGGVAEWRNQSMPVVKGRRAKG